MADEDNKKKSQPQDAKEQKAPKRRLLPLVIAAVAVLVCASAGFVLGRIFGGPSKSAAADSQQRNDMLQADIALAGNPPADAKSWYYSLEPVVANLDEPGVTRYVRAALTLEMSPQTDEKKGIVFLEEKKPFIINWLTIYLASLTLEDIRGDQNLKRIQAQILDMFNEKLFPSSKPQVKHILFKEFAVQ